MKIFNFKKDPLVVDANGSAKAAPRRFIVPLLIVGGAAMLCAMLYNLFFFEVDVRENAVVMRFGNIIKIAGTRLNEDTAAVIQGDPRFDSVQVLERNGLFFKIPFIDSVTTYNNMLLTYSGESREVITRDKKKLVFDNNVQWRIDNPALFQISMGNIASANLRIDDIMYSKINEKVGRTDAHTLIADQDVSSALLAQIIEEINLETKQYGIRIVDVRIKRTDLPQENYQNVYNRMRTEREQMAMQYRSEGREEAQIKRSEADRLAQVIVAQAYAQAETLKGEGDAEAARIYNEAYNQDPEFYEFYRTLQAYARTLADKTTLVIDADSDFAKFLLGAGAEQLLQAPD